MLEHGNPEAKAFLAQLEKAKVTPWRCYCGCASINPEIERQPEPSAGLHILADFMFGAETEPYGAFVLAYRLSLCGRALNP